MNDNFVLNLIPYLEPFGFGDLCHLLNPEAPLNRQEWEQIKSCIQRLDDEGLIEVERDDANHIVSLIQTEKGYSKTGRL